MVTLTSNPLFPENGPTEDELQKAYDLIAKKSVKVTAQDIKDMKPAFIFPYHSASLGARKLAQNCSFQFHKREYIYNAFEKVRGGKFTVINWGNRRPFGVSYPEQVTVCYYNDPVKVNNMLDHIDTFTLLKNKGIPTPDFTTSVTEAIDWHRSGRPIFAKSRFGRTTFSENLVQFVESPFWTVYKKKTNEYRVHVAFGDIIAIQEKKLRETDHLGNPINPEDVDFRIQSGENGFILRKTSDDVVARVRDLAKDAIKACELDFGAVDIINNRVTKKSFVYKVRPSPLLNEDLAVDYGKAFQKRLDNLPF